MKVKVKGETEFGLPQEYVEIELPEPSFEAIFDYFAVDPKIRKYIFPVVNNQMSKMSSKLHDGDVVLLQAPYAGG